jgi:hypothetical protein
MGTAPLVSSYLSCISGVFFDAFKHAADQPRLLRKVLVNSLLFILGFSAVFMTFGFSFGLVGQALIHYQETIRMLAGVLIGLFGLYISGALEHLARLADVVEKRWGRHPASGVLSLVCRPLLLGRYLIRSVQLQVHNRPAGYVGAVLVGFSFAVGSNGGEEQGGVKRFVSSRLIRGLEPESGINSLVSSYFPRDVLAKARAPTARIIHTTWPPSCARGKEEENDAVDSACSRPGRCGSCRRDGR